MIEKEIEWERDRDVSAAILPTDARPWMDEFHPKTRFPSQSISNWNLSLFENPYNWVSVYYNKTSINQLKCHKCVTVFSIKSNAWCEPVAWYANRIDEKKALNGLYLTMLLLNSNWNALSNFVGMAFTTQWDQAMNIIPTKRDKHIFFFLLPLSRKKRNAHTHIVILIVCSFVSIPFDIMTSIRLCLCVCVHVLLCLNMPVTYYKIHIGPHFNGGEKARSGNCVLTMWSTKM